MLVSNQRMRAGGTILGVMPRRSPNYLSYILAASPKLERGKILVMMFTLLTASRLAAHVCAEALPGWRSWGKAMAVTALLLAGSFASSNEPSDVCRRIPQLLGHPAGLGDFRLVGFVSRNLSGLGTPSWRSLSHLLRAWLR